MAMISEGAPARYCFALNASRRRRLAGLIGESGRATRLGVRLLWQSADAVDMWNRVALIVSKRARHKVDSDTTSQRLDGRGDSRPSLPTAADSES
jgi:hypothetical protein